MQTGISVYPALDNTPKENLHLIESAAKLGVTRIFTSLHIPETNQRTLKEEFSAIVQTARKYDMEIISDISPATLELLGMRHFSLAAFQFMGIHTLRIDYGYGAAHIAELSRNTQNMRIQINASTVTGKFLTQLLQENADFDKIDALHNFYPREGTGLAEATLVRKTAMLHKAGISVGAFVPCHFVVRRFAAACQRLRCIATSRFPLQPATSLPSAWILFSSAILYRLPRSWRR